MGYDLHITRKNWHADPDGPRISFEEWQQYVASDPEVIRDPLNSEHDFLFIRGQFTAPLFWNESCGEVHTKNPNDVTIQKMVEIAQKLNARVLGDDDEVYPQPSAPTGTHN